MTVIEQQTGTDEREVVAIPAPVPVVDPETGEVMEECKTAFAVTDEKTLDEFMRWALRLQAQADAVMTRPEVQAAEALLDSPEVREAQKVVWNAGAMAARLLAKRDRLIAWQTPLLERVVGKLLGDGKSRTWRTLFGSISLRKKAASYDVVDETLALPWIRKRVPGAVHESIGLRDLKAAVSVEEAAGLPGLSVKPEGVTVTVQSEVKG